MVRTKLTMLVVSAVVAALAVAGCDRPEGGKSQALTPGSTTDIAKPVDKSASASDQSAADKLASADKSAGSSGGLMGKSDDTATKSADSGGLMGKSDDTAGKSTDSGGLMGKAGDTANKSADSGSAPPQAASGRDDAALTAKVSQSIQSDPTLKAMPIKVDTKDGTVTLSGSVDTPDLRMHAHQIAAATPGVAGAQPTATQTGSLGRDIQAVKRPADAATELHKGEKEAHTELESAETRLTKHKITPIGRAQ